MPLAIVLCPRGGSVLEDELREIAQSGVQILVSMLEPDEADWLGLSEESALAAQLGMRFLSYPIQDVQVPANVKTFREFVRLWPIAFAPESASPCTAGEASAARRSRRPAR